ncbi:MAG: hypothetical protein P9L92_17525 [Candidatus Electryonea clarkiae]|nr:hypothetical protein [Candidatus Electryonea clarkiae]MDP8286642.1 hypothetical protein [Candidatus Electryonea clarkiae]
MLKFAVHILMMLITVSAFAVDGIPPSVMLELSDEAAEEVRMSSNIPKVIQDLMKLKEQLLEIKK